MENSNSYSFQAPQSTPQIKQPQPSTQPSTSYQMAFPEIYYKLQPYILMACDQFDFIGATMPNQNMLDNVSDSIYDDFCMRNPDLAEYARGQEENNSSDAIMQTVRMGYDSNALGWRFRRRGLLRDLIDALLLSELFGRRRRRYY